ncbi:ABC transporter substrate-binding protein [Phaeobacter sp. B1627]|uniref:ABC transporter substrate-binding protein n=1 Tax=Phaeobacter sp. B1627 TaxID=2583809 RepID=UPI001118A707|nr:ABC transporter substrate-binding protein [Phaeobacter sp. B1627]TNJ41241.1 hypothetical protein FGE21_14810 [Phaeobacter sp. B1627]
MLPGVLKWLLAVCVCISVSDSNPALATPLELFIDADFSKSPASSTSIELGIRTALEEVNYRLGGQTVTIVQKDHRTNVKRSYRHMQEMKASETALLMFGGMHSPPYLTHKNFMNENGLLTLLPWSAAGPITRAGRGRDNWIFRLSVDDFKSGSFLVDAAVTQGRCQSVALLLMDTGWGHANRNTLEAALAVLDRRPDGVEFFPTAIGEAAAGTLVDELAQSDPDCVIMLADWRNGALLANALAEQMPGVKLFSHWGIMGGAFSQTVSNDTRMSLSLSVLQTCGLQQERAKNSVLRAALRQALPEARGLADVPAPTGFVHGYDLTRILIAAAEQAAQSADWQGTISAKRRALKTALENLRTPVPGILKEYTSPFSPYDVTLPDSHEALGERDLCLARFGADGRLEDPR